MSFNDEVVEDSPEDMFDDWHHADEVELPDVFEEMDILSRAVIAAHSKLRTHCFFDHSVHHVAIFFMYTEIIK